MSFANRMREIRELRGLTQKDLATKIGVGNTAISNYEKGTSFPNTDILYKIFDALDIDPNFLFQDDVPILKKMDLSSREKDHIEKYRDLSVSSKNIVDDTTKRLLNLEQINKTIRNTSQEQPDITLVKLPYYDFPASAGVGNFTDYEYATYIDVIDPPRNADYIVRVSGDSMEPTLYDGDKLYIQKVDVLAFGDIGLFAYGGSIYVKEYGRRGLISHNKEYSLINGSEDIRILGKVLGKVEK